MSIFTLLLANCIPLLLLVGAGYFAGKKFAIDTKTIADLVIFIISPVVVFGAMARLPLQPQYFLLPLILLVFAAAMTLGVSALAHKFTRDNLSNLIGMGSATANTGYFGLPIILVLFDPKDAGLYLLMTFALTLNESSFAYYVGARGQHTIRDSVLKVLRLPVLYALLLGLAVNLSGFQLPAVFNAYWDKFAGSWTVIGMMLIGVALSKYRLVFNAPLLLSLSFTKFIVWPGFMLLLAFLDRHYFHLYDERIYKMLLVIGSVPVAANVVAFATQLNVKPGEAAVVVLISTFTAVLYLPLILYFFG